MWAVDVDHKDSHAGTDGIAAWGRLEHEYRYNNTARCHETGTKGWHLFYLWDSNRPMGCSTGRLPKGMEVKAEGGYVIFPPSP
jgi:hypothetical protein